MADRHSLTIQIDPTNPGHVAVVVNTPTARTYAGFGPRDYGPPWFGTRSKGRFDVHTIRPGETPPPDFSNLRGHTGYASFTIPVSRDQAEAANAEIERIRQLNPDYNFFSKEVCTAIANRIMSAAGLGSDLYMVPQVDFEYLSDIAKTLAANPHARVLDKTGLPIPEALRGLQQDSVFPGDFGGPSPRVNFALGPRDANGPHENNVLNGIPGNSPSKYPHAPGDFGPSLPNQNNNFNDRFGSWTSPSADTSQPDWPAAAPPAGSPLGSPGPLTLEQAYLEYRSQMNGANAVNPPLGFGAAQPPQATTAVPAAPAFTPPRNASAWFAEMTGVDPNDPTRPAAMPDEDQLQAFVGRQPILPWTLQRR